ncbi:MAG: hypothetical protein HY830_12245 [Actinobacteria bacterium]|nr:hypothetical protein [Actinomycetota bacterium]
MERVRWREEQGVRFLLAAYTGATSREALEVLEEVGRIVEAEPDGAFLVTDVRGTDLDRAWVSRGKSITMTVFEPRQTRIALLGVTEFQRLALTGMQRLGKGRRLRPVSTLDEAVAWFASA